MEYYAQNKIQDKWKAGQILGHDCLVFASGKIVMAQVLSEENPNDGCVKHFWVPLCDTELEKIEIYNEDNPLAAVPIPLVLPAVPAPAKVLTTPAGVILRIL